MLLGSAQLENLLVYDVRCENSRTSILGLLADSGLARYGPWPQMRTPYTGTPGIFGFKAMLGCFVGVPDQDQFGFTNAVLMSTAMAGFHNLKTEFCLKPVIYQTIAEHAAKAGLPLDKKELTKACGDVWAEMDKHLKAGRTPIWLLHFSKIFNAKARPGKSMEDDLASFLITFRGLTQGINPDKDVVLHTGWTNYLLDAMLQAGPTPAQGPAQRQGHEQAQQQAGQAQGQEQAAQPQEHAGQPQGGLKRHAAQGQAPAQGQTAVTKQDILVGQLLQAALATEKPGFADHFNIREKDVTLFSNAMKEEVAGHIVGPLHVKAEVDERVQGPWQALVAYLRGMGQLNTPAHIKRLCKQLFTRLWDRAVLHLKASRGKVTDWLQAVVLYTQCVLLLNESGATGQAFANMLPRLLSPFPADQPKFGDLAVKLVQAMRAEKLWDAPDFGTMLEHTLPSKVRDVGRDKLWCGCAACAPATCNVQVCT